MTDPLSAAASIITVIQLATTVVTYLKDVKDAGKDRNTLLIEISSITGLLSNIKYLAEGDGEYLDMLKILNVPNGPLDQFKSAIEKLARDLEPVSGLKGAGKSLAWPFKKAEAKGIIDVIERQKALFSLALQSDHLALSREMSRDVARVVDGVASLRISTDFLVQKSRDDTTARILEWLSVSQHQSKHRDVCTQRLGNTGEWLLQSEEFFAWCSGQSENVLWCHGIPGAGKTVLSSVVIDDLRFRFADRNTGIAFFYCDYRDQGRQSPSNIIASLLRQVSDRRLPLLAPVAALYKKFGDSSSQPPLQELESTLQLVCRDFDQTFIVIDALDECDDKEQRGILLKVLRGMDKNLFRIMVTSRPYLDDLTRNLGAYPQIRIEAGESDIRTFLARVIDTDHDMAELLDPALREEAITAILQTAQGMFLLPALQIRVILEQTSRSEIRRAIKNLPKGINATFEATFDRINNQAGNRARLALATLTWISHARRPLGIEELRHALAITPGNSALDMDNLRPLQLIITCCLGLVQVDQASGTVRLVHFTLREYFRQHSNFLFGEDMLAEACLTYLSFDVFAQGPCPKYGDVGKRLASHPFLGYAASNWGHHVRYSSKDSTNALALEFLSNSLILGSANQSMHAGVGVGGEYLGIINWTLLTSDVPFQKVTGLVIAAEFNLIRLARLLVKRGVAVDEKDHRGRTALHVASGNGDEEMVTLLLQNGADVKVVDDEGCNALHFAAEAGHETLVVLFLENTDLEVDSVNSYGQTALHWAAFNEHTRIVSFLHQKGADVNARNARGETALHWSSSLGHLDMVKQLLTCGASSNSITNLGETVLQWAGVTWEHEVLEILLGHELVLSTESRIGHEGYSRAGEAKILEKRDIEHTGN